METNEVTSESGKGATHGHWDVRSLKKLSPEGHRVGMIKAGRRETEERTRTSMPENAEVGWGNGLYMSSRTWGKFKFC